ncbi:MAG: hypothetical protein MJZ51_06600 [Bacteroidales bacterium]|nr:hypothetical protein [Bacteroidales bacterium]
MKHFVAKIWVTLACCIILMHAVVPHHHHDSCGEEGFVFESEVSCQCSCEEPVCEEHHLHHHHGESHHPLNHCKLQDLLGQLVISHKNDEVSLSLMAAPVFDFVALPGTEDPGLCDICNICCVMLVPNEQWLLPDEVALGGVGLRAPPAC